MTENQSIRGVSRRNFIAASGTAGALALAGCTTDPGSGNGTDSGLSGSIDISGSSTVYPQTTAMQELFNEEHPDVDISVSRDGTSGGFENAFIPGKSDINNASRSIKESEIEQCEENGFTPLEFLVSRDALTVIVNNENDWVDDITLEELRTIWSPDTAPETWQEIRSEWPDEPFDLYGAATTSGTFDYFTETVVGEEDSIRSDFEGTEEDDLIAQGVEGNEYAMGYLPFAYYTNNPDATKALSVDGVEPSLQNAKRGDYELARPLYIYVRDDRLANAAHVEAFVRFYVENSVRGDLVAERIGYVPISEEQKSDHLSKVDDATG